MKHPVKEQQNRHMSGQFTAAGRAQLSMRGFGPPCMQVLPRAFQLLGCSLAVSLLVLVGVLTWFTIHGEWHQREGGRDEDGLHGRIQAT